MAQKKVQLKDLNGNSLLPKTLAELVTNANGDTLETVEAGAQVNILEKVQLNGTDIAINNKTANIVLPAAIEYSIVKAETPDAGMSATYQLAKDGVVFGTKINVAKDMVVSKGEVKSCTVKDVPVAGLNVGDPYIELTIANSETPLYIPCKDFVDVYTAGNETITIADHKISVNLTELQKTFYTEGEVDALLDTKQGNLTDPQLAAANSGITEAKRQGYDAHLANADVHVTAEQKTAWTGKQDALSVAQLAACNSGIDATAKAKYDAYAGEIGDLDEAKADKATTLAGYGIGDAYTKTQIDNMVLISYDEIVG